MNSQSRCKKLLFLIVCLLAEMAEASQPYTLKIADPIPETWRWTFFSELEGKGVRCMTESENGTIWFGTDKGLVQYDGYNWKLIKQPTPLTDLRINCLLQGNGETIYAGTDNGLYSIQDSSWINLFPEAANLGIELEVTDIAKLSDQSILFSFFIRDESSVAGMIKISKNNSEIYASESTQEYLRGKTPEGLAWQIVPEELTVGIEKVFRAVDLHQHHDQIHVAVSNDSDYGKIITYTFDLRTGSLVSPFVHSQENGLKIRSNVNMTQDTNGQLWVVSSAFELGVFKYDGQKWNEIKLSNQFGGVNSQNSVLGCTDGSIWVEGHGRIFRLQKGQWSVYQYPEIPISTASRMFFHETRDGNVWIVGKLSEVFRFENTTNVWTTYEGLNFQFQTEFGAEWYLSVDDRVVLNQDDRWMSYQDEDGLIDTPVRLYRTSYGEIWAVGSDQQTAAVAYFDGKSWNKMHFPEVSWGFDHRAVYESNDGSLWLGTSTDIKPEKGHLGGVVRFPDPRIKHKWIHYSAREGANIEVCYGIGESNDGVIWFGGKSLWTFDGSNWKIYDELNELREYVNHITTDASGALWLASRYYGVFRYKDSEWTHFTVSDGLSSNNTLGLYTENANNLWVLTYRGINHFNGEYWTSDLFSSELVDNPKGSRLVKSHGGEIWFNYASTEWNRRSLTYPVTQPNAFSSFQTVRYVQDRIPPETRISTFSEAVEESGENVVFWRGNDFFEVTNVSELQFSWSLNQGEWSKFSTDRYQRFNNLPVGKHHLAVRSRDHEFNIDPTPASITFIVLAPWWKRTGFLILASLTILIIIYLQVRTILHYRKLQFLNSELNKSTLKLTQKNEKIASQKNQLSKTLNKMDRLSQSRLQFFTNISHEFRTPLSLIMGPVRELKDNHQGLKQSLKEKYYFIIDRNAHRLLRLINQILEIYKVEDTTREFVPKKGDIRAFIKDIGQLFESLAQQRNIDFRISNGEKILVSFDPDKMEKIIFNLLSNAFKNVPYGGKIEIELSIDAVETTDIVEAETDQVVKIAVSDNGKGISPENVEKIFERFFHVDHEVDKDLHVGIGIGLSYVKDLIRTHQGSINVSSEPGKVTTFTVAIPYLTNPSESEEKEGSLVPAIYPSNLQQAVQDLERSFDEMVTEGEGRTETKDDGRPKLLIVEDEEDARIFLRHSFEEEYMLFEAENGALGLKTAVRELPDLIISDVMMPEMNGIELCKKIKSDFNTSHIPVVLLTAKTQAEHKLQGYDTGADAYVEKPFNLKLLQSRVSTILKNRQLTKQKFRTRLDFKATEMDIASVDETFIQKTVDAVEAHMDDSMLGAEALAHEVGVSRIQLYRKIKALTGQTVNEFIKSIRLKHAANLLVDGNLNISQIAYRTGFSAPNHFATYFRKYFGITLRNDLV
ncbi:MAG: ATP-binding protein, partial [Bacteroidota bacterium]